MSLVWELFRCQFDYKIEIIRLVSLERSAAFPNLTALLASIYDYIPFFRIRISCHRLKLTQAAAGAVSGIYINVNRPQTIRAMIA